MASAYPVPYVVLLGLLAVLAAAVLAGLLRRQRGAACYSFAVFLVWQLVMAVPMLVAPATWWTWRWVLFTDAVEAALFVVVAIEVAHRALRAMPPGLRQVTRLFTLLLGGTLAVLAAAVLARLVDPEPTLHVLRFTRGLIGGAIYGSAFLFLAFVESVAHARVPLDPVHRDIAAGLGMWGILGALSQMSRSMYLFTIVGVNLILAYWAYKAWRPEEPTVLSREALTLFQPWRLRRLAR